MNAGPKRQHWVPQFYLRHFAAENTKQKKVWILSRQAGDPRLTNIENIALEKHLYSPKLPDGTRDHTLEKKLCDLEGLLATFWPELANDFVDLSSESNRKVISLFLAVQFLRHPERREEGLEAHRMIVDHINNHPVDSNGNPDIQSVRIGSKTVPFNLDEWLDYRDSHKDMSIGLWGKAIEQEATPIAEMLMKKRWSIVFIKEPLFVTSDFPVYVVQQTLKRFQIAGKNAMIQFPISPTRMLCFDDLEQPRDQYYPIPDSDADFYNLLTWVNTEGFLISSRPIEDVLGGFARVRAEYEPPS